MTTDNNDREAAGLLDVLRHVVETLRDVEHGDEEGGKGTGTVTGTNVRTDYGFTVRTGPGPDPKKLWEGSRSDESASESESAATEDHHIDVREDGNEVVVIADLPQATIENVTVGIDRGANDLVIGLEGEVIDRIGLGDADITVADSTFRNGVLEVRLRVEGGTQ